MMESLEFSEDEIKRQLAALGYFSISEDRMKQFRKGNLLLGVYFSARPYMGQSVVVNVRLITFDACIEWLLAQESVFCCL